MLNRAFTGRGLSGIPGPADYSHACPDCGADLLPGQQCGCVQTSANPNDIFNDEPEEGFEGDADYQNAVREIEKRKRVQRFRRSRR